MELQYFCRYFEPERQHQTQGQSPDTYVLLLVFCSSLPPVKLSLKDQGCLLRQSMGVHTYNLSILGVWDRRTAKFKPSLRNLVRIYLKIFKKRGVGWGLGWCWMWRLWVHLPVLKKRDVINHLVLNNTIFKHKNTCMFIKTLRRNNFSRPM